MEVRNVVLSDKQQLIYEACAKIYAGQQMVEEGSIELAHLTGEKVKGKKPAKEDRKIVANRMLTRGTFKPTPGDEKLEQKALYIINRNDNVSSNMLHERMKIGERVALRIVGSLMEKGLVTAKREDKGTFYRSVPQNPQRARKTTRKKMRANFIDVSQFVPRALEAIKKDEWMNHGKFADAMKLGGAISRRLVKHLIKKGLIKFSHKPNNPIHKGVHRIFGQKLPYLEVV